MNCLKPYNLLLKKGFYNYLMNKIFFFFLFFTSSFYFKSQDTVYARSIISKLSSKEFLGRGYVNYGVNKSAKFLAKEFKSIGLLAFGENYFQNYRFNVNTFPYKISVSIDQKKLEPGKHFLIAPSSKTIKATCQLNQIDSVSYKAVSETKEVPLKIKLRKKLTYTVATDTENIAILELLKDSFPNELKLLDIFYENKFITNYKCQNICGYIKGIQQPDTFIVFSAHYDHLGAMGPTTYFPGANDNASGVSALLNLAKYYKKNPIKYSVAFIMFSGEEAGLLGSKHYIENPLFPLSQIKFLTNLDLFGTGNDGIMVVNATFFKSQFLKLNSINEKNKYLSQIKQRGKAANSDHYWFSEKNIPSFFIYTLGGISAYHDIYDIEKTLPLTDYIDVCKLLIEFVNSL
jgi:aminopeptidase YwaD